MTGFKKEVREFMAEVRGEHRASEILEKQIDQLRDHLETLMDRVMSEGLRDYKVHKIPLEMTKGKPIAPEYDESRIGQQVELPEG